MDSKGQIVNASLSPDCRILYVRKSIYRGKEQEPKTPSAVRNVDIAEPLAQLLQEYKVGKPGYLFATSSGKPLGQRNVLRALHTPGKKIGLHSFRRFRTANIAACACTGGPNNNVARPLEKDCYRFLRQWIAGGYGMAAEMVQEGWLGLWATRATKSCAD